VALVSILPLRVDIGGINEIATMFGIGIEDCERLGFIGAPAEDISAEA